MGRFGRRAIVTGTLADTFVAGRAVLTDTFGAGEMGVRVFYVGFGGPRAGPSNRERRRRRLESRSDMLLTGARECPIGLICAS